MKQSFRKPFVLGIWLEYSPVQGLTGEGISRLISWILQSLSKREDVRIVVALAKWSEKEISELLQNHQVDMDRVEILPSRRRTPFLIRARKWLGERQRPSRPARRSRRYRLARRLWRNPILGGIMRLVITTDSIALVLLILVAALLLFPLIVCAALLGGLFWKLFQNRATRKVHRSWRDTVARTRQKWIRIKTDRWYPAIVRLWKEIESHEFKRLARKISQRQDVDLWYSPNPSATHVADIRKPVVVAVPDLVYVDFVNAFRGDWVRRVDDRIRKLTRRADATISYSPDVRARHVIQHLGVPGERAHVIRHGAVDVAADLREEIVRYGGNSRAAAKSVIETFIEKRYVPPSWTSRIPTKYLEHFPFDEVPFIFTSCQLRPNKNYLNLFRAYEFLLRRRHRNIKLIMTGSLEYEAATLTAFIEANGLDLDILSIPNLPLDVHAAFYHFAALTVIPTLFEGGFPFQFTESMSMGTPVVMSDIPVVRESLPHQLRQSSTFDPTNPLSMAAAIEWGLDHRAELLAQQTPFYHALQQRTWNHVADDYLEVFKEVASGAGQR